MSRTFHGDGASKSKYWYLYKIYRSIKDRCNNVNIATYGYYGGRGISISFNSYPEFKKYILDNLGERPEGYTLDRIDNEGNYEPGNLRWATRYQQTINRRTSKLSAEDVAEIRWLLSLGYYGVAIAHEYGVHNSSINRIKSGECHASI